MRCTSPGRLRPLAQHDKSTLLRCNIQKNHKIYGGSFRNETHEKNLACVLAGAALLTATGCSGSQDPKRLLVAHGHGDWHPVHIGLSTMCDEMEKETDYTFDIYPNGQLGDDSAMIQLVKAGVLDVAKVSAGALEQFNQAYSIFSIPYVFQSTEHYFDVMNNSEAVQEIFESTRKDGFIAIGLVDSGARSIYTTKDGPAATPGRPQGPENPYHEQPDIGFHDQRDGRGGYTDVLR